MRGIWPQNAGELFTREVSGTVHDIRTKDDAILVNPVSTSWRLYPKPVKRSCWQCSTKMGVQLLSSRPTKRWGSESSEGTVNAPEPGYDQSISEGMQNGARRFDDVIDRIWCKVIPVTGMWNHTIRKQRSGWIQPTLRQASGSMNDSWTTPDGVHRQIRLHRSAPQGSYEARINSRKDSAPTTIRK